MSEREDVSNLRLPEVLFDLFIKEFPKLRLDWNKNWSEWTEKIFTFFANLGEKYRYGVYVKPGVVKGIESGEYLVDLCWVADYEPHMWMELALEEELSYTDVDSIIWDFCKIIDLKAYTKVGIFAPKLSEIDEVLQELKNTVTYSEIKVPTERYLVIFILYHGKTEKEERRIEITGYEINYLGDLRKIGSARFPSSV